MRTVKELMELRGRSAIVTGGAGHIGLAICETLMELGANVAVLDIDEEACNRRCEDLNKYGYDSRAIASSVDLSDIDMTRRTIEKTANKLGSLDIIIHSAAFVGTTKYPGWAVPFETQSIEAWDTAMRVNLSSVFIIAQAAQKAMSVSGNASIILISSIYGMVGPDNRIYEGTEMVTPAAYAASKGGIIQMTKYLGTILAPRIRVNCITAGGVERGQAISFKDRYIKKTPLNRMAVEEDFKGAIAYLASGLSSYVTGTNLIVDGGWTAW